MTRWAQAITPLALLASGACDSVPKPLPAKYEYHVTFENSSGDIVRDEVLLQDWASRLTLPTLDGQCQGGLEMRFSIPVENASNGIRVHTSWNGSGASLADPLVGLAVPIHATWPTDAGSVWLHAQELVVLESGPTRWEIQLNGGEWCIPSEETCEPVVGPTFASIEGPLVEATERRTYPSPNWVDDQGRILCTSD